MYAMLELSRTMGAIAYIANNIESLKLFRYAPMSPVTFQLIAIIKYIWINK